MLFYSTKFNSPLVDFRKATLHGQPSDNGLYFPSLIPVLRATLVKSIRNIPTEELAFEILNPYTKNCIPKEKLVKIIATAFNFRFPLIKVTSEVYSLELFHGPTFAFKDVGARFLSRCLAYFKESDNRKSIVLVATSGDTGGAVANGFADVDGVHTVILYPKGKVSEIQELQLTTCGENVTALQVDGTFDDCQKMVKTAFNDAQLNKESALTSANSINVARWLPQQLYYLDAIRQWSESELPQIAVPSGNFGNIAAGLLAIKSIRLPIHFIAAMNGNDAVHKYIISGAYKSQRTIQTVSNAMDVGDPSNFSRILALFENDYIKLKNSITSYTISDDLTKRTITEVFKSNGYILDPHGAVAYAALHNRLKSGGKGIFLETAHPIKFPEVVEPLIHANIQIPTAIKSMCGREKKFIPIQADYTILREIVAEMIKN